MATLTAHSPTDRELYDGLLRNDPDAFRWIYRRMFPMVRRHLVEYGSSDDDARDVFQEGVIALWQNARDGRFQLREGVKLSTYLTQICKFQWMDRQRKAARRPEVSTEQLPDTQSESHALEQWIDRERQEQFQQLFAQLGDQCQDLLQRFYYRKESLRAIASHQGIGEASAKNKKFRCMQSLRDLCQTAHFTF
ncbi:MAG: sigma-70 family RNA polymerase sigma factor [Catalinimonas sp.]